MPNISGIITNGKTIENPDEILSKYRNVHAVGGVGFIHREFKTHNCVICNTLTGILKTTLDQPASDSVQRLTGLLLSRFYRYKTHGRPAGRFTNCLGIVGVIFTALDVRFDELRGNQAHLMAQFDQLSSPIMRTAAGLHRHQTRLKVAEEIQHLRTLELLASFDLLMAINTVNLENLFCQINANSLKFHLDFSLWD